MFYSTKNYIFNVTPGVMNYNLKQKAIDGQVDVNWEKIIVVHPFHKVKGRLIPGVDYTIDENYRMTLLDNRIDYSKISVDIFEFNMNRA